MLIGRTHGEPPCIEAFRDMRITSGVFAKTMHQNDDCCGAAAFERPVVQRQRLTARRLQCVKWLQAAAARATGNAAMTSATAAVSFFA